MCVLQSFDIGHIHKQALNGRSSRLSSFEAVVSPFGLCLHVAGWPRCHGESVYVIDPLKDDFRILAFILSSKFEYVYWKNIIFGSKNFGSWETAD